MLKPLAPYDDRYDTQGRDFAATGSYSLYALERMLRDCQDQPDWRMRASICAAYYDGNQLTELQRAKIREEKLDERVINLIRPVVNSVLGQEARSRTDVKVESDDDSFADVAEVIGGGLKEAERETLAHMAVSECYSSNVKKGMGWVNVGRNTDVLAYPYRVEHVPNEEMWWDWRGQKGMTLDDRCRWVCRMRMIDLDEIEAAMPKHRKVLAASVNGWDSMLDDSGALLGQPDNMLLTDAYENERRFNVSFSKWQWMDSARKMVKVIEVWYRVPAEAVVLVLGPTRRVPYNPRDPRHVEAVARGLVKLQKGITSQVRRALYAGPHRLLDEATNLRRFPYIPMFAFRDDANGSPYGLIDGMIAPQDEFNERRHHIQWMLKARQVQMDSDAVDPEYNTIADIVETAMRPDMVAITNPNRANKNQAAITIRNDLSMQPEQFNVMADSKQLIQDTAGRYASQLGQRPAGVTSGVANNILVEQGEQSMGEMNDNYTIARRQVFEALVGLIVEDHQQPGLRVPVGAGKSRRVVVLNQWDGQGMPVNMVSDAEIKTGLGDIPNTPAYRNQTQTQVAQIISALGNNAPAVAVLAPAYIESTSLPNRQQVADDLRKATGQPIAGDKEGRAQAEAQQQAAQQAQNQQLQQKAAAEIDVLAANSEQSRAQARKANAEADLVESRVHAGVAQAEVAQTNAQTVAAQQPAANEDEMISNALADAQSA